MALSQDYVNQLVREAAAQAGGTLSFEDVSRAAADLGIPASQVSAAMSTGVILPPVETQPVYFQQNPDVAVAYQQNSYGLTPEQFAQTHYTNFGQFEQRAPVGLMSSPVVEAAPEPVQTVASNPAWDYDEYVSKLKTGNADFNQELGKLGGVMGQNAQNIYREILAQQGAGSGEFWSKGNTASPEAAAADFALRLAENGVGSLNQVGQTRTVLDLGEDGGLQDNTTLINKATGQPLPRAELLGRGQRGLGIDYNLSFTPDGTAVPFTSNRQSSWMQFREDTLKPAAMFVGSILGSQALAGAIGGAGASAGAVTDASFLAADAAQLASQGLSEAQIAQVLGASGYASGPAANLAASMAANGLDAGMMTQQLNSLSSNTGLMSQTGSSADFLAADALQLQGQLGNNFAAIEQNLIASGVDPLIAADVSQQLAFNPNLTQTDLATKLSNSFGNNIYDVNMAATYPTSVLPGEGGLLSNTTTTAPTTTPANTAASTSGLTNSQIGNLIKAGVGLLGTGTAVNAVTGALGGGNNMAFQAPTQGVPTNDPNYYNQLQQYYNSYLPQTPRDVVTPLQQWYNS